LAAQGDLQQALAILDRLDADVKSKATDLAKR
jgi:hypothetical protein